jgi:hypothetical protein
MLIVLLPDQLSQAQILLLILVVLAVDVAMVVFASVMAFLFIAFKAGKGILKAIDKAMDWAVYTVLRIAEDFLESPPFDKVPILQLVLVGVKKAYDLYSAAQGLIVVIVNIVVTLVAIVLAVMFVLAFVALNAATLGAVIHYVV